MPRRKTYKKIIERNYDSFHLSVPTFRDVILYNISHKFYDKLGRLTRYAVLKDSKDNYILCVRKHECPLFIDSTVKSYGSSCCNVGWYYYISKEEFDKLKFFCLYEINNTLKVDKIINDIQARASIDYVDKTDGKQIYAVATFEIDSNDPNMLVSFFKPESFTNKSTKEYIKNVFFRTVRYEYAQ